MSRSVVVTGGAKGIGRALVARFLADGDRVTALGRDEQALTRLLDELHGGVTGELRTAVCDVTDEAAVAAAFERPGRSTCSSTTPGVADRAPLARTTLADWARQLDVNATGAFLCTRAALPAMLERDRGRDRHRRLDRRASSARRYTAAYTASKHAAVGLMRAVAAEVAGTGVTANAVCPAFVDTDDDASARSPTSPRRPAARRTRAAPRSRAARRSGGCSTRTRSPTRSSGSPRRGARAINGQTLVLDGGGIQA